MSEGRRPELRRRICVHKWSPWRRAVGEPYRECLKCGGTAWLSDGAR